MTARELFVLGSGGLAREMAQLAAQAPPPPGTEWRLGGFISASRDEVGHDLGAATVIGDDDWLLARDRAADLVIAIGHPGARRAVIERYATDRRFRFPNLIHPTALIDLNVVALGRGNCITAGCIFTCDIDIGDFNLFNWHTTVGHDAKIGSGTVINPASNISGGVHIGDHVLVGTGAQILEGRTVSSGATIGAGAVVTKDVPSGTTVIGVPAKPLES